MKVISWHLILISAFFTLLQPINAFAHSGRTDSSGGHNCYVGSCAGTYHYHNGGTYTPSYDTYDYYTPPSIPTCPLFSRYNSLTDQCECNYGYVASGSSCISEDQACKNDYGYGAEEYLGSCRCRYGYVWNDSQTRCVMGTAYCSQKYGLHTNYDSISKECECSFGYVWNQSGTKCISEDESCRNEYGYNSEAGFGNTCECKSGYVFNTSETECISEEDYCYEQVGVNSVMLASGICGCEEDYALTEDGCVEVVDVIDSIKGAIQLGNEKQEIPTKEKTTSEVLGSKAINEYEEVVTAGDSANENLLAMALGLTVVGGGLVIYKLLIGVVRKFGGFFFK